MLIEQQLLITPTPAAGNHHFSLYFSMFDCIRHCMQWYPTVFALLVLIFNFALCPPG